jgi:hypothetical protein
VYVAGNKEGKLKEPVSDVRVLLDSPVASFVAVTMAPGITAPPGSATVPEIVPVVVCARSGITANLLTISINAITDKRRTSFQQVFVERSSSLLDLNSTRFPMAPPRYLLFAGNKKAAPCICKGRLSWTLPLWGWTVSRTMTAVKWKTFALETFRVETVRGCNALVEAVRSTIVLR